MGLPCCSPRPSAYIQGMLISSSCTLDPTALASRDAGLGLSCNHGGNSRPPYAKAWPCGSVLRTQPAFEGRSSRTAVASSMTPVCDVPTDTSIHHHSVHRHLHGWCMGPLATKRRRLNSGMPACWPDMQVTSAAMPCIDEVWHTDHLYVRPPAEAKPCSCKGHETSLSRSPEGKS